MGLNGVLSFREVTPDRWGDFERLFEERGGPKACWCMVWRATPVEGRRTDGASRKVCMKQRIDAGTPVGLLAYQNEAPVAWCSIAPRSTYRRLVSDSSDEAAVWSIACLYVVRSLRGEGVSRQLIDAAVTHAAARGAQVVEAYPVDADSPSYRFMGFVPVFEHAGFVEIGREGARRHVMRLAIRPGASFPRSAPGGD
jgi:GNAT superfamily N-acetyltransferase